MFFEILENGFWAGIAALGFGLLFNIPKRIISKVFILGFLAGLLKFACLYWHCNIITASFVAAILVGVISILFAQKDHFPVVILSIPSIIPMIPGYYAYKTILAIRQFTFESAYNEEQIHLLNNIFVNGFTTFFILFALTAGVSIPMLLLGKDMTRKVKD
jgi:uncharacterized membrane protein YjjB (DUF3815 family)